MIIENVIEHIKQQAIEQADKTAVIYDGEKLTYLELYQSVISIAGYLKARTIGEEDIVVVYMDRSINSVLSVLGILAAGAAFLPVDSKTPIERLNYILKVSEAKLVLSDRKVTGMDSEWKMENIEMILNENIISSFEMDLLSVQKGSLAYVIFTSGSTGRPKGAMIEHGGMNNHLTEKIRLLNLTTNSVIAHNASISFDISVWQILTPLCIGGTLIVFSDMNILNMNKFLYLINCYKVSILEIVPTYLNSLLKKSVVENNYFESLQYIISTGEPLPKELAKRWFSHYKIPLVNAYGPTEASDDITHYIMTKEEISALDSIPIGKPIRNAHFYVKDEHERECNVGEKGELWVSGICVGRGYIGNSAETEKLFGIDKITGYRLYKTGDLVVKKEDGNYLYFGRKDMQIKLHGHRIEIKEIENVLLEIPHIQDAAVIYDTTHSQLAACYVAEEELDKNNIIKHIGKKLPEYMIPSEFARIDRLPVNINGKVDREKILNSFSKENKVFSSTSYVLEERLKNIALEILGKPYLPHEEAWTHSLKEIGFNSVLIIDFITKIEIEFDIEFEDAFFAAQDMYDFKQIKSFVVRRKIRI